MAITIISPQPDDVSSTGNIILLRVTSDSTDVTTKIQCKLYYRRNQDEFYILASVQTQNKAYGKNYFEFNIGTALNELLTHDLASGSTGLSTGVEHSAIQYQCYLTEYYPDTAFAAHDATITGTFVACNTNQYKTETVGVYTGSDWYMDAAGSHKFLTDSPSSVPIRSSERIQLDFLTSYTDPVIKVKETKNNGSNATVTYELPDATYQTYLWDFLVDDAGIVTIAPVWPSVALAYFITPPTGTSGYRYMADQNNVMWGGLRMVGITNYADIDLPNLTVASATLKFYHIGRAGASPDFKIWYQIASVWTVSALGTQIAILNTWTLYTEVIPANATSVRIVKDTAGGEVHIPNMYVEYIDDNVQNKRCQFTLDTTHIDSDTNKLEIWAESTVSSSTIISEVKTFQVDTDPYYGTTVRFAAKNKRGGFDHFTYTQGYSEILSAEKVKTTKELPNTFTTKDRGLGTMKVVSEKIFTCYSKYVEESVLQWWATIIESEEVFVIVNDSPIAVDILTSSVISNTHTDLVQLKIDWTYAFKR